MLTVDQIANLIDNEIQIQDGQVLHAPTVRSIAEKIAVLTQADATMLVAAQTVENEVTSHLVDLVAATVLATLIYEEGGGRSSVAFSPHMMDEVVKNYTIEKEMHGALRNVRITLRPGSALDKEFEHDRTILTDPTPGLMRDNNPHDGPVKPQAEQKVYDRPVWAVRTVRYNATDDENETVLRNCHDRADAERQCRDLIKRDPHRPATVENRYCLHPECPSTGCTLSEATSVVDKG